MEHRGGAVAILSVIRTVPETGSTNADMLADRKAEEGRWLRAERQHAGRGRQGREWVSPAGNLYASTLVRLQPIDPSAATLALVAAVALAETVAASVREEAVVIKWPNDLLIAGAKLSGILLERYGNAVVVGFGVNLAHHPELPDRATTSLAAHGANVAPDAFLETLAVRFAQWLDRWRSEGLAPVRARWLEHAHAAGTALAAHMPDGTTTEGQFDGLDADGALMLRLAGGERRVIHAADVFLI